MKVAWATDIQDIGNAYGFTYGNRYGRKALEIAGVEISAESPITVHHCPPHAFKPVKGKFNVLWTAWEFEVLPKWEGEPLSGADYVLVTARFLVSVLKKYVAVPVEYVPQGIDVDAFWPKSKKWKRGPFRVLWVGAPNDRKGHQFVVGAWHALQNRPEYELYLKTTAPNPQLRRVGNVIFDSRDIGQQEMRELYQSADCFAFPTMGEGFGFTMGEAMACGLPCLYTPCTALLDLADSRSAIPIAARYNSEGFKLANWRAAEDPRDLEVDGEKCVLVPAWEPDATDLALKILQVKDRPRRAEKIGRRAALRIRERFTWPQAGRKLRTVLEKIERDFVRRAA